jgi:hypothetical protein
VIGFDDWRQRAPRLQLALAVTWIALAIAAFTLSLPMLMLGGAILLVSAGLLVAVYDWRWSVCGLLLYIPFSGLSVIAFYPNDQLAVLVKDLLFVVPAYAAFILNAPIRKWVFPGAPVIAMTLFALLAIADIFNPESHSLLGSLIGLKVWLLYLPLMLLGYHLIDSRQQLTRILGLIALPAAVPAAIAILEAVLLYTGHSDAVYKLYGRAAVAVFQNFTAFEFSAGLFLPRVPSVFSFVSQYFDYTYSALVAAYAWWRLTNHRLGIPLIAVLVLGLAVSGGRSVLFILPTLAILAGVLEGSLRRAVLVWGATAVIGVGALFAVSRGQLVSLVALMWSAGTADIMFEFVNRVVDVLAGGPLGMGTGSATGAARYAFGSSIQPITTHANTESWWIKLIYELGPVGLVLMLVMVGRPLWHAIRFHLRLPSGALRSVSTGLVAFVLVTLVFSAKAPVIDLDPINVYFWLFLGVLAALPNLPLPDFDHAHEGTVSTPARLERSGPAVAQSG